MGAQVLKQIAENGVHRDLRPVFSRRSLSNIRTPIVQVSSLMVLPGPTTDSHVSVVIVKMRTLNLVSP